MVGIRQSFHRKMLKWKQFVVQCAIGGRSTTGMRNTDADIRVIIAKLTPSLQSVQMSNQHQNYNNNNK